MTRATSIPSVTRGPVRPVHLLLLAFALANALAWMPVRSTHGAKRVVETEQQPAPGVQIDRPRPAATGPRVDSLNAPPAPLQVPTDRDEETRAYLERNPPIVPQAAEEPEPPPGRGVE